MSDNKKNNNETNQTNDTQTESVEYSESPDSGIVVDLVDEPIPKH